MHELGITRNIVAGPRVSGLHLTSAGLASII